MGIRGASLSIFGEPLLDPLLLARAERMRDRGMACSFFTNGQLFHGEMAERVVAAQVESVTFSIDAYDSAVYESIRVGLSRDRVYKNVLGLLSHRSRVGAKLPRVYVTALRMAENEHDLPAYMRFWRHTRGLDGIVISDLRDWAGFGTDGDTGTGRLVRPGMLWLPPCRQLWGALNVLWDGRVVACCDDAAEGRLIVGDVRKESLQAIWRGKRLAALRDLHRQGRARQNKVCAACGRFTVWW
jgi:hypothetical protein